jgi:glutamine---fructose-6-phosphate transaminase (isomerizing)
MLKEIMSQPKLLEDCMRGRVNPDLGHIRLGGLEQSDTMERLVAAKRIIICACGTSFHSGLVGEYLLESIARISVEVEYASEFRYRNPILDPSDIVIVISQSGETADTLAALKLAKERGCHTIGLVNVVGSSIARETHAGVYLHVGPEIGVASTKAFTGQVLVLTMMAVLLGHKRGFLDTPTYGVRDSCGVSQLVSWDPVASSAWCFTQEYIRELASLPSKIEAILGQAESVYELSRAYRFASNFLFLGRGYNFPVALEGALKLKEISYIHAEGYAAAEMKHGPIALIDKSMPVVVVAPRTDEHYGKLRANMEEVLARGGCVIAVTDEGNTELEDMCEAVVYIPTVPVWLTPMLTVVPLQLLSYYIADLRKCSVDQPRNLAKSVTVE